MMQTQNLFEPDYRFALRARIHAVGFRTLSQFADKAGVHVSIVSKIATGRELPTKRVAGLIADGLGISIEDLKELL
jgi:transcriptional regulator with XRE-family HTH domain